jgi:hypothetical protein
MPHISNVCFFSDILYFNVDNAGLLPLIKLALFPDRHCETRSWLLCDGYGLRQSYLRFTLPYFLCLDAKKVTKKDQGQHEGSARLSGPTPHISNVWVVVHFASLFCTFKYDNAGLKLFQ